MSNYPSFDLNGQVALVTGASKGIGYGLAKALAKAGAKVVVTARDLPMLEQLAAEIRADGGDALALQLDVLNIPQISTVMQAARDHYGRLDILVHSVAFGPREDLGGRFVDISREGFKLSLDISAYSLIALAKRSEPLMTDGGSIMSLTYYAAEKVMPKYNVMAIAKAALEAITRYLAADLGPKGIRVNTISAGPIKTLAADGVPGIRTMLKYNEKDSPLRANVTQEEVGDTALYLASDLSRKVTGETIHVDSGYHVLGLTASEEDMKEFMAD